MLVNLFSTEMPDPKKIEEILNQKFLSKDKFAEDIESLVLETKMSYIDAIVQYCEDNNIEVDTVNKLVSKPLKEKIRWEATELNYLKKTSRGRLPL
jgi:hypothetical protein